MRVRIDLVVIALATMIFVIRWRRARTRARRQGDPPHIVNAAHAARNKVALGSPDACRLVVKREAGYRRDLIRRYAVVVDDDQVGQVASGGELGVEVPAGPHVVQVRLDGFRSRRLSIQCQAGAEVVLLCRPRDPSLLVLDDFVLGLFGRRPWILLEEADPPVSAPV